MFFPSVFFVVFLELPMLVGLLPSNDSDYQILSFCAVLKFFFLCLYLDPLSLSTQQKKTYFSLILIELFYIDLEAGTGCYVQDLILICTRYSNFEIS